MSAFTYRQKALAAELIVNVAVLIGFLLYLALCPGSHNFAPLFLFVSWYFPILYGVLKIHTTEDTRTDERDRDFENRGRRDGYGFLSFGVFMLIWLRLDDPISLLNQLLVIWILSRLVANGKQLRLYAGHESWLPDSFRASLRQRTRRRFETRLAEVRAAQANLGPQDEDGKQ